MFQKIMCRILGIDITEHNNGIKISLEKMAKKHPKFTEQVLSKLVDELTEEGANVRVYRVSNEVKQ